MDQQEDKPPKAEVVIVGLDLPLSAWIGILVRIGLAALPALLILLGIVIGAIYMIAASFAPFMR